MTAPGVDAVRHWLQSLQDRFCESLEAIDGGTSFERNEIPSDIGLSRPYILTDGPAIEKAAVNFTHTRGARMPASARPDQADLAGCPFEAVSMSTIVHPRNPYAPTMHANLRLFVVDAPRGTAWWFGGGFDLTPYYGFEEDAVQWHQAARDACPPGEYEAHKAACDAYFVLPHRDNEARGIGGLFFDLYDTGGFPTAFGFVQRVGDAFTSAYPTILRRRTDAAYGDQERQWQLLRRGRYVEFNLLHDRGTRFGLAVGGRTERVLASLPPHAAWAYEHHPEPGSPEARLLSDFLTPRDWLRS